jgi:hypothetical protein
MFETHLGPNHPHEIKEAQMEPTHASQVLLDFPVKRALEAIARRSAVGETQLIREFRQWVVENVVS